MIRSEARSCGGYGLYVLRFSNREIETQFPEVCQKIRQTIEARR